MNEGLSMRSVVWKWGSDPGFTEVKDVVLRHAEMN